METLGKKEEIYEVHISDKNGGNEEQILQLISYWRS